VFRIPYPGRNTVDKQKLIDCFPYSLVFALIPGVLGYSGSLPVDRRQYIMFMCLKNHSVPYFRLLNDPKGMRCGLVFRHGGQADRYFLSRGSWRNQALIYIGLKSGFSWHG